MKNDGDEPRRYVDLVRDVADRTGMSQYAVRRVLGALSDVVREDVTAGRGVRLRNIGTIFPERRPGRHVRLPGSGFATTTPGKTVIRLKATASLHRAVNEQEDE